MQLLLLISSFQIVASTNMFQSSAVLGEGCVVASVGEAVELSFATATVAYSNIGRWRANPIWNDMPSACPATRCRTDSNTGNKVAIVSRDITASNQEWPATVELGISDLYNADVPSGMLIRNGATSTSGVAYDVLVDVDASKVPTGMHSWEYYQFANWENSGSIHGSSLIIDVAVVGASTQNGATTLVANAPVVLGGANTLYGQTTNEAGAAPYKVGFVLKFFVAGTTTPATVAATRLSVADLDAMTFPNCDGGLLAAHDASTAPSCAICGSATATISAGGSVDMADCTAGWIDGSAYDSHGLWGQECLYVDLYGTGAPKGVNYVQRDDAAAVGGMPPGKSLTVSMATTTEARLCGSEAGFAGDNAYDLGALSSSVSASGSWSGGTTGNYWTSGAVAFHGIDQKARSVTLLYESVSEIAVALSTQPHAETWTTSRTFVVAGSTNVPHCSPPPPPTPPPPLDECVISTRLDSMCTKDVVAYAFHDHGAGDTACYEVRPCGSARMVANPPGGAAACVAGAAADALFASSGVLLGSLTEFRNDGMQNYGSGGSDASCPLMPTTNDVILALRRGETQSIIQWWQSWTDTNGCDPASCHAGPAYPNDDYGCYECDAYARTAYVNSMPTTDATEHLRVEVVDRRSRWETTWYASCFTIFNLYVHLPSLESAFGCPPPPPPALFAASASVATQPVVLEAPPIQAANWDPATNDCDTTLDISTMCDLGFVGYKFIDYNAIYGPGSGTLCYQYAFRQNPSTSFFGKRMRSPTHNPFESFFTGTSRATRSRPSSTSPEENPLARTAHSPTRRLEWKRPTSSTTTTGQGTTTTPTRRPASRRGRARGSCPS